MGGARGGVDLRECDCRSRGKGSEDLLPTVGHAEAGEESDPPGSERQRRSDCPPVGPEGPGQPRGGPTLGSGGGRAKGVGPASPVQGGTRGVLGRHAGSRGQRVLRPVKSTRTDVTETNLMMNDVHPDPWISLDAELVALGILND